MAGRSGFHAAVKPDNVLRCNHGMTHQLDAPDSTGIRDRYAARELFGVDVPPGPLPLRAVRNADFKEVSLEVGGAPALRFASAYGFRNIQQLMRQMKRQRCAYDYVEVMACPSGEAQFEF